MRSIDYTIPLSQMEEHLRRAKRLKEDNSEAGKLAREILSLAGEGNDPAKHLLACKRLISVVEVAFKMEKGTHLDLRGVADISVAGVIEYLLTVGESYFRAYAGIKMGIPEEDVKEIVQKGVCSWYRYMQKIPTPREWPLTRIGQFVNHRKIDHWRTMEKEKSALINFRESGLSGKPFGIPHPNRNIEDSYTHKDILQQAMELGESDLDIHLVLEEAHGMSRRELEVLYNLTKGMVRHAIERGLRKLRGMGFDLEYG